ncbi:uncharacterized protein L969DRAFT_49632 [Mixia osmundae IAM 14324]|uniref:Uncharacterized protein n=1 Tax=Mixia osmundae (strain CBS 9802 / IAM 14324 / JCM 22182 / KY 12970) TaxID=764103 RepID=G7DVR1_MIXOS|nr:uncharacterized protein L969DRAFT_49632 [Mixia osmundae IAM 14324]KEI39648.1 hypothetical protein L969DRAFT_49632 [Mixia osmundae IAM 14324]GAA94671.1 hypothetical protein E5Q_01324 [Mixia osmundae IAM 14324]
MSKPKLLRLRLARPPPRTIAYDVPFKISLTLTNDLGDLKPVPHDQKVVLTLLDAQSSHSASYATLASPAGLASDSKGLVVTLRANAGSFHSFDLFITRIGRNIPSNGLVRLDVRALVEEAPKRVCSEETERLLAFTGHSAGDLLAQDEGEAVWLGDTTGSVSLSKSAKSHSPEKVQECFKDFYPAQLTQLRSQKIAQEPLRIIELPAQTLGAHVWNASIILSAYLLTSTSWHPSGSGCIVELGAGCGLVGLCAHRALTPKPSRVHLTDLPAVLSDATAPNVDLYLSKDKKASIEASELQWGIETTRAWTQRNLVHGSNVSLLAADVLYNTSSYEAFIDTISVFFGTCKSCSLILAFRERASTDKSFFDLCAAQAIESQQLHGPMTSWGPIQLYKLSPQNRNKP